MKNKNMKAFIEKQRNQKDNKEEKPENEKETPQIDDDDILDLDETIDISNDNTVINAKLLDEEKNKPKGKKTRKK